MQIEGNQRSRLVIARCHCRLRYSQLGAARPGRCNFGRRSDPGNRALLARLTPDPNSKKGSFGRLCLLSPKPTAGRRERDPLGAPLGNVRLMWGLVGPGWTSCECNGDLTTGSASLTCCGTSRTVPPPIPWILNPLYKYVFPGNHDDV